MLPKWPGFGGGKSSQIQPIWFLGGQQLGSFPRSLGSSIWCWHIPINQWGGGFLLEKNNTFWIQRMCFFVCFKQLEGSSPFNLESSRSWVQRSWTNTCGPVGLLEGKHSEKSQALGWKRWVFLLLHSGFLLLRSGRLQLSLSDGEFVGKQETRNQPNRGRIRVMWISS